MAILPSDTAPTTQLGKVLKLSVLAQNNVVAFANKVLAMQAVSTEIRNKMDHIDIAYARYKSSKASGTVDGVDNAAAKTACGNAFTDDRVTPPIVASQVDSYVAYLADVFLSGSPIFPVVSNPSNKKYAEQLETLLDDHASLGGYVRQLLLFLKDAVKYNRGAMECDWDAINQFSVAADFTTGTGRALQRQDKFFTKLKRLDPRNVIVDPNVPVGDLAELGDFAGYVEELSRTKLKRELNKLTAQGEVYNADRAMASSGSVTTGHSANFHTPPVISEYMSASGFKAGVDWDVWFDAGKQGKQRTASSYGTKFERFVLYARIQPADFGISAPQPNTPQIWKFVIINGQHLISAKRIVSAYDYLPILFGQPLEDGLGDQTQSIAEGEVPFQEAAATLFNIRFAAARRAVSDRGLYRDDMVSAEHINHPGAAAKIPVTVTSLSNLKLSDAYFPIPFSNRGLENVMQDAQALVGFSKELHGLNAPRQGQFQKGNKSVKEWDDTMAGSDGRMRLPALLLEHQFFSPLKSILVLNIFQYGSDAVVVSQKSGENITIKMDELRKQVLAFRVADGYTPKSKLASTEGIMQGLTLISTSPILQQQYGSSLPAMFAHMMSLMGVRGLEEYDPQYQAPAAAPALPGPGMAANGLQVPSGAPAGPSMPPGPQAIPPGPPAMPPQPGPGPMSPTP